MEASSPLSLPSSFDPALHLHSELPDIESLNHCPSESFDDDIEALHFQRQENLRKRIVIQHRAWNLSDVFRSDEDIRPDTPTRTRILREDSELDTPIQSDLVLPSSPPTVKMPFISSTTGLPPTSSPGIEAQKRKIEEAEKPTEPKRIKTIGGFVEDDEEDDDMDALRDAQLESDFALREPASELYLPTSQADPFTASVPRAEISNTASSLLTLPLYNGPSTSTQVEARFSIKTCSGKTHNIRMKETTTRISYERLVAERSTTTKAGAQKSYYGIEIHKLMDDAAREAKEEAERHAHRPTTVRPSIETLSASSNGKKVVTPLWTEKYRARRFTDLIGDERTHRSVLRWLKGWDPIVFPNLAKAKSRKTKNEGEESFHRKVLLLTGPPGLGKTTLAHVCARQAGYEVLEINASDERSKDVVKGRIRDAVGTENVKSINVETNGTTTRKAGRPVCVVVDEVDGVVSGAGGSGEGGFMKALIELVQLDQKNSTQSEEQTTRRKKKTDKFRLLRPLILICNDVYHPSLRPLRASTIAEIIHVRHAPLENVVQRMKNIFAREGIPCDGDGVRRLCETSWGIASRREGRSASRGVGEGDIRSVLVTAEWIAHKLRDAGGVTPLKLSRAWFEQTLLEDSRKEGSSLRGLGRGGVHDIINRVFIHGAGFPEAPTGTDSFRDPFSKGHEKTPVGVADIRKRHAINRLREMVDASGEYDRCASECFATYPTRTFQDDTFLSKPNAAYEWLYFHDTISSRVFSNQDWELNPYLSQSVLAFHHLFSSSNGNVSIKETTGNDEEDEEEHPFSGVKADFAAFEAMKQNRAILHGFQSSFSPPILRLFRSMDCLATDLVPNLLLMLSPDVKPVVVRGQGEQKSMASVRKESERALVRSAIRVMTGMSITFEKARVENEGGAHGGWIYRMEPPLDVLTSFSKVKGTSVASGGSAPVRYAVRQVLDQEYRKETMRKQSEASQLKYYKPSRKSGDGEEDKENSKIGRNSGVKRDFFGRIIEEAPAPTNHEDSGERKKETKQTERRVWVTFHEGFSNAVRKPISLNELLVGL